MSSSEEMSVILPIGADAGGQGQMQSFTLSESDLASAANYGQLKPIIMTMANMANVSEEVQVSTQETIPMTPEQDLTDTILRSHLLSSNKITKSPRSNPYTSEIFTDNENGVTYEVVKGGTKRGGDRLIDSLGFTYNLKAGRGSKNALHWWCSVRNTKLRCPAMVIQRGKSFMRGKRKHEHLVGQNTPKPHVHNYPKTSTRSSSGGDTSNTSGVFMNKKIPYGEEEYKIIKCGSKAGMDLLKDKFGYTFTLKKSSHDKYRTTWRCSIRNKVMVCKATVYQAGNTFKEGPSEHSHMPNSNQPLGMHDVIPKHGIHDVSYNDEDDEEDDGNDSDYQVGLNEEHTYINKPSTSFNANSFTSTRKITVKPVRMHSRERKRKEHPTFLGPSCTINLTKCDSPTCNCKMVHCPFCDPSHFIPAKAGRVQDHLELTHFAHGVQYDDLMIVKCFQDCNAERNYGHYHCVFCFQQILKRNAYARHMLRHMRKMGIPDRLLVLPDSKFPDVINAYGFEIPICKKTTCQSTRDRHYHCPQCQMICQERSLTVNHLWRCLQRKADSDPASEDEDTANVVEERQLNLHFSHYKNFNDLPLFKCQLPACCGGMYHCRLCPVRQFVPTYRQHLIAHYMTHWKQRVAYKGYSLLKCFQVCEGLDRSFSKVRYHFHCPICCKMILTKGSFVDHLRGCHLFKFGENLLQESTEEVDKSFDEDRLAIEMTTINDNVDYMEDRVTSQAIAMEEERSSKPKRKGWASTYGGKFRHSNQKSTKNMDKLLKVIKAELSEQFDDNGWEAEQNSDEDEENESGNLTDDILGLNIKEDEIFDLGTVIFSEKLINALKSAAVVSTVLGRVSHMTNTKLSEEDGRYMLCGKIDDLVSAKNLMISTMQGTTSEAGSDTEEPPPKRGRRKTEATESTSKKNARTPNKKNTRSETKKEKELTVVIADKKGRGRPKTKSADSFPYSEIKEIIEASKQTDTGRRRRGRPSKNMPIPSISKKGGKGESGTSGKGGNKAPEPTSTPRSGRYGTRGIKRNYLEMSVGKTDIKKEIMSDEEDEDMDDEDQSEEEEIITDDGASQSVARKGSRRSTRGKGKADAEQVDSEQNEDDADNLDDSEQETQELDEDVQAETEELSEMGAVEVQDGGTVSDAPDGSPTKKIIIMSPRKKGSEATSTQAGDAEPGPSGMSKITDGMVKNLRTSNVATSVPAISKVGIRKVAVGKRKQAEDDEIDKEMEKVAGEVMSDNLRCSLCDEHKALCFSDLTAHLKQFHHVYEPPRCDICELDFDTTRTLSIHIDKKHGPRREPNNFTCSYDSCSKVFTSQVGLTGHVNKVHLGQSNLPVIKRYVCEKCQYKTNSRDDLWEHRKIAHDEQIECKPCNMVFVNYNTLKKHNDLKHMYEGILSCGRCNKQFSNKTSLEKHEKLHNTQYNCNICNKNINSKASYLDHLERHKPEMERKYRHYCAYCGKGFSVKSNYEDHQNKHTGNRPYKCDACPKAFGFRSMLKKHKTFVHSSERPFKCGFCMKGFKFMNLLKNHVTIHTNASKHVCTYCNKIFSTASSLKYHMKKCGLVVKLPNPDLQPQQILIYSDSTVNNSSIVSIPEQGTTVMGDDLTVPIVTYDENLVEISSAGPHQVMAGHQGMTTENVVLSDPLPVGQDVLAQAQAEAEVEVYACSECNMTFKSFQEAESHVLTAHSAVSI